MNITSVKPSKYASLSTEKLQALAKFKLQELLTGHWAGSSGQSALNFVTDSAGLVELHPSSPAVPSTQSVKDDTEARISGTGILQVFLNAICF
jgi:hypothetical protein